MKKVFGAIGLAIIFGLVSSLVFNVSNMAVEALDKKTGTVADADNNAVTETPEVPEIPETTDKAIDEEPPAAEDDSKEKRPENDRMPVDVSSYNPGLSSVVTVAEEAMPSIVAITNKSVQEIRSFYGMGIQQYEATSAGSGIIIGQNDTELLIVTNAHVVSESNTLTVCFIDEQAYEAQIKGTDDTNDLAIIAVQLSDISGSTLDSIKIATMGSSDDLKIGEQVVAIGNALGYGQSVTTGIVSALNRAIADSNKDTCYIQTDAAINPGNSGGALLNMKGELVGINSAKLASEKIEGMGYAIPINSATPILDDLMTLVTRSVVDESEAGYLGISGFTVTDEVASMYNIPKGVYISETNEGSAARLSGIQQGDVIVKFDGMNIDSINKLRDRMNYYKAGETVDVVIARADEGEYKEKTLKVVLGKREDVASQGGNGGSTGPQGGDLKLPGEGPGNGSNQGSQNGSDNGGNSRSYSFSLPGDLFKFFR